MELVRKKVKYVSCMAGAFVPRLAGHREYNVINDIPAAQKMIEKWPTEIVFSGFEIGETVMYPSVSVQKDFEYVPAHPIKEAYRFYRGIENEQPTFDMRRLFGEQGYQASAESRQFEDHIGFELLYLALRYSESSNAPSAETLQEIQDFIRKHPLSFINKLNEKANNSCAEHPSSPGYYPALLKLTEGLLLQDAK